jgi:hypothetical protein
VVKVFAFPITRDVGDFGDLALHPHPGLFSTFVANKALIQFDAWASLAPRLGGPWATLGPPLGHPIPDPIPIGRGSQTFSSTKYQVLSTKYQFWPAARSQQLEASFCQRSKPQGTLQPRAELFAHRVNRKGSVIYLFSRPSQKAMKRGGTRPPLWRSRPHSDSGLIDGVNSSLLRPLRGGAGTAIVFKVKVLNLSQYLQKSGLKK